jgi:hypothetical protein
MPSRCCQAGRAVRERRAGSGMSNQVGKVLRTLAVTVGLDGSWVTPNGYLVLPAILARTGVIDWGRGERENFSADVLLTADGLRAWSAQVVTDDHPTDWLTGENVSVTSANARFYAVGFTQNARQVMALGADGAEVPHLGADVVLTDQATIDAVRAGKRQLSIGAFITREVAGKKATYDWEVTAVEPNHVALVDRGACGGSCKVALGAPHPAHDERSAEQKDTDRRVVAARLSRRIKALTAADTTEETIMACNCGDKHVAEMAALTAQHEQSKAQLAAANAQLDVYRAQEAAQRRTALLTEARKVLGAEYAPAATATELVVMADVVASALPAMADGVRKAAVEGNGHYVTAAYQAALAARAAAPTQQRNMGADIGAAVAGAAEAAAAQSAHSSGPTLESMLTNLTASQARIPGFTAPTMAQFGAK